MPGNGRQIREYWCFRDIMHRWTDSACIVAGLWVVLRYHDTAVGQHHLLAGVTAVAVYFLVCEFTGMYRGWRNASADEEAVCAVTTWAGTAALLVLLAVATGYRAHYYPTTIVLWFVVTPMMLVLCRGAMRALMVFLRNRGVNARNYAIVGINPLGLQLHENVRRSGDPNMRFVGFYDDRPESRQGDVPMQFGSRVGNLGDLVADVKENRVNLIYITFPMRAEERIREILGRLADSTASVYIVPDFSVFEFLHSRWTNIGGLPVVSIFENPFFGIDGLAKRLVDIGLASFFLVVLAIPMLVIALFVKLTSPGPVLFRQRRYGLDGREILVWKFRTMTVCQDGDDVPQACKGDVRVTPLGAILRSTSLDELPQLFNVLWGTMSLVGPRPHANAHNEEYRSLIQGYMLRHKVKPGMTGLAQVNGWRGETDTLEKMVRRVECDHRYIREWSLLLDLRILVRTIYVVLRRDNAH